MWALTDYKNVILTKILNNENLLKALTINYSDSLAHPLTISPLDIVYNYVFPYKVHQDIITDVKSMITMEFVNFSSLRGNKFQSGRVHFYIICHKSLIQCDYGLRYDYILNQINQIFNKAYGVGSFKLTIDTGGDLYINEDYLGSTISYRFTDFQ